MKNVLLVSVLALTFGSNAVAGPGHTHGPGGHTHSHGKPGPAVTEDQAKAKSKEEIGRLVKKGKLDASWSGAEFSSIEKKETKGKMEWLATYKNEKATDKEKTQLFIFLDLSGKFVAANHTGK